MTTPEELDARVAELKRLAPGCSGWVREPLERAADDITALRARVAELEAERDDARAMLAKANNEFGSETWSWPDLWRRIAQLKDLSNERWRRAEAAEARVVKLEAAVIASAKIGQIVGFLGSDEARIEAFREACGPDLWAKARAALVSPGDGWVADLNAKIRADVEAMAAERGVTPAELLATAAKNLAALRAAPPASEGADHG